MRCFKRVIILILLLCFTASFFACDIGEQNVIAGSGTIFFDGEIQSGVQINSSISSLCIANDDGSFMFQSSAKSITVVPKLDGYFFVPRSITITSNNNELNFTAVKIEELDGTLKLKSICITPTSIASVGDNYLFVVDGEECIKLCGLFVKYNDNISSVINNPVYLVKNRQNYIDFNEDLTFDCHNKASIGFLLNANFVSLSKEWSSTNASYTFLNIINSPTNADLQDNTITYSLYGINSETKAFTYDISFAFEYVLNQQ